VRDPYVSWEEGKEIGIGHMFTLFDKYHPPLYFHWRIYFFTHLLKSLFSFIQLFFILEHFFYIFYFFLVQNKTYIRYNFYRLRTENIFFLFLSSLLKINLSSGNKGVGV